MAFFEHNEGSIHYLERGRGEPLLLIHGLGSSGADWGLQVPCLERRCRLIVPDLPGSGHSEPLREGYSVEGMAAARTRSDSCQGIGNSRRAASCAARRMPMIGMSTNVSAASSHLLQ